MNARPRQPGRCAVALLLVASMLTGCPNGSDPEPQRPPILEALQQRWLATQPPDGQRRHLRAA